MRKFEAARAAVALWSCIACFAALAQDYPSRPVRVVVPSAPGGGFDLVGRVLAQKLGEQTGQAFVVENRPGAGTLVGTQFVARAAPDGYNLVVGGLSNIALNRNPATTHLPISFRSASSSAIPTPWSRARICRWPA